MTSQRLQVPILDGSSFPDWADPASHVTMCKRGFSLCVLMLLSRYVFRLGISVAFSYFCLSAVEQCLPMLISSVCRVVCMSVFTCVCVCLAVAVTKELHTYVELGLGRNLQLHCSTALQSVVYEATCNMTGACLCYMVAEAMEM